MNRWYHTMGDMAANSICTESQWSLVAATRLGYAVAFDFYSGKKQGYVEHGLGESVVYNLFEKFPEYTTRHYHLIFDNFFTTISLFFSLRDKGIAATGTLHQNRDVNAPLKFISEKSKYFRGSFDVTTEHSSKISLVRWKDNKPGTIESSFAGAEPVREAERYEHGWCW